jgi:hypothetical protein
MFRKKVEFGKGITTGDKHVKNGKSSRLIHKHLTHLTGIVGSPERSTGTRVRNPQP